jgi:hypothetical protein
MESIHQVENVDISLFADQTFWRYCTQQVSTLDGKPEANKKPRTYKFRQSKDPKQRPNETMEEYELRCATVTIEKKRVYDQKSVSKGVIKPQLYQCWQSLKRQLHSMLPARDSLAFFIEPMLVSYLTNFLAH